MKKMMFVFAAWMISMTAMAQDAKKETTGTRASDHPAGHECYMMKDNALMHCNGKTAEAQEADVKLSNGMVLTRAGHVLKTDGTTTEMKNGQCMDLQGSIGDCAEMHKGMEGTADPAAPDKM